MPNKRQMLCHTHFKRNGYSTQAEQKYYPDFTQTELKQQ